MKESKELGSSRKNFYQKVSKPVATYIGERIVENNDRVLKICTQAGDASASPSAAAGMNASIKAA